MWNNGKNSQTTNGSSLSSEKVSGYHSRQNLLSRLFRSEKRSKSFSRNGQWKGYRIRNSRFLFPDIPCTKKEQKVTANNRSIFIELIHKETGIQNGDSQVCKKIEGEQRLGCLHRSDRCIPSHSDTSSSQKVCSLRLRRSNISVHGLTFRNVPKSVDFHQADGRYSSASTTMQYLSFPYLDDWLIKDLIRNRLISQTKYCLQVLQVLGFIPNLKKSELIPSQNFTFIGMEFLTQQNLVRVPTERVQTLILTIKSILTCKQVSERTFLSLLGRLSAAADCVFLARLHLRPLQMCLLSVWKPHILPIDHPISINGMIRFHLQ